MRKKILISISLTVLLVGLIFGYKVFFSGFGYFDKDVEEVVFAENIVSYNPYTFTETNDQRLRYIYDPLVKLGTSLEILPALAVSYGNIDDLTWEFRLNPNATFHDGTKITADTIKQNFDRIMSIPSMKGLVDSIDKLNVTGSDTFTISTLFPDPLLLNKLSQAFISPPYMTLSQLENNPVGSGAYQIKKIQKNKLHLLAYDQYYGHKPKFEKLILSSFMDQVERVEEMNKKNNIVLAYPVPRTYLAKIDYQKYEIGEQATNSVNFFLFNFKSPKFNSLSARKFFQKTISDTLIISLTEDQGLPVDQFVGAGVLGFDDEIEQTEFESPEAALAQARNLGLIGATFKVALSQELSAFKDTLEQTWFNMGFLPQIDLLPADQIAQPQFVEQYDLIFLGWKSDYGDALSFFENIAVTDAGLNLGHYSNTNLDHIIEQAKQEFDTEKRRALLERAMQIVAEDDPIGVPLFETEAIYATNKNYSYTPRLDAFIDINNLQTR